MSKKPQATKTLNPLHFEDLEPHRFEDLVRRLLYGFRDWTNIEATGRSGSDEGFDVRAWEKGETVANVGDDGEEGLRSTEERVWQVQGKREKTIAPTKMRTLIKDGVHSNTPPYGYILAAATNISKATYDAFREELRKKGVTEFYFWGKDYLEDQLALPQNDEILFTFFGVSLSPRRRSRTTELKFTINNKNKIQKLVFGHDDLQTSQRYVPRGKTFLLRDIKAEDYPYHSKYPDFAKRRRWEEHDVVEVVPWGAVFRIQTQYAYVDPVKKEWDYSTAVDLTARKHDLDDSNKIRAEDEGRKAERFWRHLPRRFQAKLMTFGIVAFEDMLIIDEHGDTEHTDPHIFIDFGSMGPFRRTVANLVHAGQAIHETECRTLKRIKIFPATFPDSKIGSVHEVGDLGLGDEMTRVLGHVRGASRVYSVEKRLAMLTVGSIIKIPKREQNGFDKHTEVTSTFDTTVGELLGEGEHLRGELEKSAGRTVSDGDRVTVYELFEVLLPFREGEHLTYLDNEREW